MTWWIALTVTSAASDLPEAASPESLLTEARARARRGDTAGVRVVAEEALRIPGDHQRTAQYLVALSHDLDGDPQAALALYDPLSEAWSRRGIPADLAVRRAACLATLSRHAEALRQLRAVGPARALSPVDRLKVEVLRGAWHLQAGRERRGLRHLDAALQRVGPDTGPWHQARAREVLLRHGLAQAAALDLRGDQVDTQLQTRAQLLSLAQDQVVEIVRLDQPQSSLRALHSLAMGHAALGDDLGGSAVSSPTPEVVWVRAVQLLDRAQTLAARSAWTGDPVSEITQDRAELVQRVESASPR